MKDAASGETGRGGAKQLAIRPYPNGETHSRVDLE